MSTEPYYSDDSVTLYHGDCLEHPEWWTGADVLVTDPPYGLGDRWTGGTWGADPMYADAKRWDHKPADAALVNMASGREAIIWGGNYFSLPPSRGILAWVKTPSMETMADMEIAWTSFDMPAKLYRSPRNPEGKRSHPTQKPQALMEWCIRFTAGELIADPFAGSGTTLVAAKAMGRRAVGLELDERYCEIAAARLSQDVLDFGGGAA